MKIMLSEVSTGYWNTVKGEFKVSYSYRHFHVKAHCLSLYFIQYNWASTHLYHQKMQIASDLFVWCRVIYLEDQLSIALAFTFVFFLVTVVTGHECTGISCLSRIICCIFSTFKYSFLPTVRIYSDLILHYLEFHLSFLGFFPPDTQSLFHFASVG